MPTMYGPCFQVFYNRYILLTLRFNFPISLTLWHMVTCSCLACLVVKSGMVGMPAVSRMSMMRRVIPIAAAYAVALMFSNQALSLASIA